MIEEKHMHHWMPFTIIDEYPLRRLCSTCGRIEVVMNHNEKSRKTDKWEDIKVVKGTVTEG